VEVTVTAGAEEAYRTAPVRARAAEEMGRRERMSDMVIFEGGEWGVEGEKEEVGWDEAF
jgi:hypothetical protein